MKFNSKRHDRISKEGTRPGFADSDIAFLSKYTHEPKTQIWSMEEIEGDPETRHYFCICKSPLTYLKGSESIWRCDNCIEYFDTRIQDSPIRDKEPFKLVPYQQHYPQYDENDPHQIFVEGIDLNKDLETREHDDRRVQTIHVKGSFADAIRQNVLSANKKHQQQEDNE